MEILKDYSLKSLNTFHVDCVAKEFIELKELDELRHLIAAGKFKNQKILILGGGSNILFTDNFDGLVVHPQFKGIKILEEDENSIKLRVKAGEVWKDFVEYTVQKGWRGIENLALIPGLVGAAPMQNIGAYGVELKGVFEYLRGVNLDTGELIEFSNIGCEFGYRTSVFKGTLRGYYLIYDVCLRLSKKAPVNISYRALEDYFKGVPKNKITQKMVFEAVVNIRNSKLPKPEEMGNAGSFFKNPLVSTEKFDELKNKFPEIIGYRQSDEKVKLAAGWLIQQAGWKGARKGDTGVHEKQALVLVNYGDASGKEIFDLSEEIKQSVYDLFGVSLEREVNVI